MESAEEFREGDTMLNLGMSREDFMANYYAREAYVARRAAIDHGVTWSTFDDVLFCVDPHSGDIQLFRDGRVPGHVYADTFDDVGRRSTKLTMSIVEDLLRNGATLVLNRIDAKSRVINDLARMVSTFVGARTVANAYVAFGGMGSFGKHWDTHDVFAMQLIGQKRWRIYPPTFHAPISGQTSAGKKHECPETPFLDICTSSGDVIYIPRGWWHEALPVEGQETAHIAVGVHPYHVIDYVSWCCAHVLPAFEPLRQVMGNSPASSAPCGDTVDIIATSILDEENVAKFNEWTLSRDRTRVISNLASIGNEDGLLHRDGDLVLNARMHPRVRGNKLIINGVSLSADESSLEFVESLWNGERGGVDDILESLPPEGRATARELLRNLIRGGVCSIRSGA
jgi:ribosomal protein L16 Arg81 hydroxylase